MQFVVVILAMFVVTVKPSLLVMICRDGVGAPLSLSVDTRRCGVGFVDDMGVLAERS